MPTVQFPDGSEIEFPEGTDEDTINRVSRETWESRQSEFSAPQQQDGGLLGDAGELALQAGSGIMEGVASIPGLPVELASWAKGIPVEGSNLEGWGAQGWTDFVRRNVGEISAPAPQGEAGRIFRKGGQFVGGGLAGGGLLGGIKGAATSFLPSSTALVGSEAGRTADTLAPELTGGYGEAVGAIAGGLAPGVMQGQLTSGIRSAPSIDDLRATADAAYDVADKSGVIVGRNAMQRLANEVENLLANEAYHPKQAPSVSAALGVISKSAKNNATLKHLDKVIRGLTGNAAMSKVPGESRLGSMVIDKIDEFMENLTPQDLAVPANIASGPAGAVEALKAARSMWHRMRKAQMIDEAVDKARLEASSSGTGGNLENRIKQNLKSILLNPKKIKGFTKPERALIRKAVEGSNPEKFLRWFGRSFSPSTGALQGLGTLGTSGLAAMFIHPGLAMVPAAGMGAKAMAEALATRNASRVSAAARGGPLTTPTTTQRANQILLEMQRRAKLAGQSAAPAIPGSVNTRQR